MSSVNLTVSAVDLALDMAQRRAEVASHNIAYANVPGATMQRADFGDALGLLQQVADGTQLDERTLMNVNLHRTTNVAELPAGTGSDLDQEVTELALASAHYQALSEALNRQFGLMSMALSGDQA